MDNNHIFTYHTRLALTSAQEEILTSYAVLYGKVERSLFAAIQAGRQPTKLKPEFMKTFGITARQYNAVRIHLQGKIASIKALRPVQLEQLHNKIMKARKVIKHLQKKAPGSNKLHQKNRRLHTLELKLETIRKQEDTPICFGGKHLFHAQFNLEEHGYGGHTAWLDAWQKARSSEFVVIGSKDETAGCQGCAMTLIDEGLFLRLRIPDAIRKEGTKYLVLGPLSFAYGQDVILDALSRGCALNYRFKRDDKGWRVFVSTAYEAPGVSTTNLLGVIGVDFNAGNMAISETDHFGNLVYSKVIRCITYGKTTAQRKAVMGNAVKEIVEYAVTVHKPLIVEKIDFAKKKAEIEQSSPGHTRTISSFAYAQIQAMLRARCFRTGVEVIEVNPAYTSTIGAVNYAQRYGISVHQAAALAIARRGTGLSERPLKRIITPVRNGHQVTFPLPVRNRGKHVWSQWAVIRRRLKAVHAAHARSGEPAPLRLMSLYPVLGPIRALPAQLRHANRQQHCSADVEDIPL
jgi:IS605 OrfB family transposase